VNTSSGDEDSQGLSDVESVDSESVSELLDEGNTFEAGVVKGVEEADDSDGKGLGAFRWRTEWAGCVTDSKPGITALILHIRPYRSDSPAGRTFVTATCNQALSVVIQVEGN
jgi:hypothetical protein